MEVEAGAPEEKTTIRILVTGANSGLGFAVCCRLIDEFIATRPQSQTLHLLFSTRDVRKSDDTLKRLNAHFQKTLQSANARTPGISHLLEPRVKLEGVLVDLTILITIKALAKQLVDRGQKLDAVIWNAGIAGWIGIDYVKATKRLLTGLTYAVTCPDYLYCDVGLTAAPQLTSSSDERRKSKISEPHLAKVFLSNVFGHYLLTHWIAPILTSESRIIWISSTSALPSMFNIEDMQALHSDLAYESSKRLTDLLVLTSELPSTKPWVNAFLPTNTPKAQRPRMYVTNPGVIVTSIVDVPWFMYALNLLILYLARWLGSHWHPIDSYKGAVSTVFAALAPVSQLEQLEKTEGKGKWGSATDVWGAERVARTETPGWGYCGEVAVRPPGSLPVAGYPRTDDKGREEFEITGRKAWQEMEELRLEWEKLLGNVDLASSVDL